MGCGSPGGLIGGPGSGVGIGSGPVGTGRGSTGGMVMGSILLVTPGIRQPLPSPALPYAAGMAATGVATMVEVATLAQSAVRLVRSRFWLLLACYCFGWTGHALGLFVSALLGANHGVLANLIFVIAVVVRLASLVLMVHVLRPALRLASQRPTGQTPTTQTPTTPTSAIHPAVPEQVFTAERPLDVLALALGPFLAVYAVWGFIDEEVNALFRSNYLVLGLGDVSNWSISVSDDRLIFYLALAAGAWVVRALVGRLVRRRPGSPVAVVGLLAEGVWALSVFIVVLIVARTVRDWFRDRVIWADLAAVWNAFVGLLPNLTLPFGTTLRELAQTLAQLAPGAVVTVFGLPLMWLALVATVYGWRDYRARDVVAGTALEARLERIEQRPAGAGRRLLLFATADLRTKYVPVAQALRLIGRAGPRFVGAYLLLATAISALDNLLSVGLSRLVGPQTQAVTLLLDPLQTLLVQIVVTIASVALYAAAFDRAVSGPGPVGNQGRKAMTTESSSVDNRPETAPAAAAGITKLKPIGRSTP
jgi:hypothetical protein